VGPHVVAVTVHGNVDEFRGLGLEPVTLIVERDGVAVFTLSKGRR
jgi:hypothetical protein